MHRVRRDAYRARPAWDVHRVRRVDDRLGEEHVRVRLRVRAAAITRAFSAA